jgi:hypothetical protein
MNTFLMLAVALGFGSLAWTMLWTSDRLLADKPEHRQIVRKSPGPNAKI